MTVSVIIPAFNEEDQIAETIGAVQTFSDKEVQEIIVVDGGSTDGTITIARDAGAKVVESPEKGRAAQMNYGAKQAESEILYFLHADSKPPEAFGQKVLQAVTKGFQSGCFRLTFDEDHWLLNLYAWFTRFDVDAFRFGDQSLFILRDAFSAIGGFREDHLVMEDNEIVRRIRQEYSFAILDDAVETSARSYLDAGILKLQFVFVLIYVLYFVGVEQETLVQIRQSILE